MTNICPALHYRCPEGDHVPDEPLAGCELDEGHDGLHLCMDCGASWAGNDLLNAAAAAAHEASNRGYTPAVKLNPADIVPTMPVGVGCIYISGLDRKLVALGYSMAWPVIESSAVPPGDYWVVDRITGVPVDTYDYIRSEEVALDRARAEKYAGHPIPDRRHRCGTTWP